jgi:hypothetical protein
MAKPTAGEACLRADCKGGRATSLDESSVVVVPAEGTGAREKGRRTPREIRPAASCCCCCARS